MKFPGQFQPLTSSKPGWFQPMTSVATRPFSIAGVLTDLASLLATVLLIPVVILAIGTPFALVIAGLLWLARVALAAL